ncbi:hypothetical protein QCN27_18435 [Cereibacter sp. SYSU M97828]|nr:hypothetical protein [Cereibacter flavus]
MKDYFGVYWTYPVRWVGFTHFNDVEHAAKISRTIRYQREAIRRRVAELKGRLIAEQAFMENAPDRGTAEVASEMAAAARAARAIPILVDFGAQNWRRHWSLRERMEALGAEWIPAQPTFIDGQSFDPAAHFRDWSSKISERIENKGVHRAQVMEAVAGAQGLSSTSLAAHLNALGLLTYTHKPWTADNVRKFIKI